MPKTERLGQHPREALSCRNLVAELLMVNLYLNCDSEPTGASSVGARAPRERTTRRFKVGGDWPSMSLPQCAGLLKLLQRHLGGRRIRQRDFCPILSVANVTENKPGFESARSFSNVRDHGESSVGHSGLVLRYRDAGINAETLGAAKSSSRRVVDDEESNGPKRPKVCKSTTTTQGAQIRAKAGCASTVARA